jgi:hypothetical protein
MWYVVCMKPSGLKKQKNPGAYLTLVLSAVLIIGSAFVCLGGEANGYTPILYPSIFWHNNQWETYENGQWVPYRDPANNNNAIEAEPEEPVIPEAPQTPDMVDTNIYYPTYGWGFIGAPVFNRPHRHHARTRVRPEHRRPETAIGRQNAGLGQPNAGIGQTAIGIGRPNTAIGRPTVGIGKPNAGIGQPTVGIGQPNVGVGQPNAGIGRTTIGIGQPNTGIGHPNTSVGQPNAGVGQPSATVGQPNVGIGSTTIGIGQPMTGQRPR